MMTMIIVVDLDIFRCFLLLSWYCRNGRKAWIRQQEHHFSNSKNRINEINDHGHRSHNNNNNVNSKNNAKKKNSSNRYQKNNSTTDFDPLPQLQQKHLGLRYVTQVTWDPHRLLQESQRGALWRFLRWEWCQDRNGAKFTVSFVFWVDFPLWDTEILHRFALFKRLCLYT